MLWFKLSKEISQKITLSSRLRYASSACTNLETKELTPEIKHKIENYWRSRLGSYVFDAAGSEKSKFYVLSMFPYPSGNLHMGHVRVYTISDAMARFYRMNGKNVLHPMGWDAFGLPAENAARQHNVPADKWTQKNIEHMKQQLNSLGCSFDWSRELATCLPNYYKWTQWLFLKLHQEGLAYQKEALVNWDPVDKTVLADEQVDSKGCSWRSGAKVEKTLLKQWFIRTTKFAKPLLDGLDDSTLKDWRDIIKLQKHWIGECSGYSFDLHIQYNTTNDCSKLKVISLWTETPEDFRQAAFVAVSKDHIINKLEGVSNGLLQMVVINPFNVNQQLPVIVSEDIEFAADCDTYLGVPNRNEQDKYVAERFGLQYGQKPIDGEKVRMEVIQEAQKLNIGGFLVSSKLKDWLISRQRHWGTPIPIVHCDRCGAVPSRVEDLPVELPQCGANSLTIACPSCGDPNARRELDTMDTFVDSSWYFLRYLDPHNDKSIFDKNHTTAMMPVDLYIGGKEHAVLHLYYARFVNHFLHSIGLVPYSEPFQRLLVQGMVMGQSFRVKGSGKYLREKDVRIVNAKKNQAEELTTGEPVVMQWEKMSKSKLNGADPAEVIAEYGTDTVRLIMLGDVAPTSHRNWSTATFPGILNWQKRLWLTLSEFNQLRSEVGDSHVADTAEFRDHDSKMFDARNYFLKEATFNYKFSHQLSVAISKMQGLTNSIRRAPKDVVKYGAQYERALAAVIIMIAPMAPHFASELWAKFTAAPNRINNNSLEIKWVENVLQQQWPHIDPDYKVDLIFKVNGMDLGVGKYTVAQLELIDQQQAIKAALEDKAVRDYVGDKKINNANYVLYSGCEGVLNMFLERHEKKSKFVIEQ